MMITKMCAAALAVVASLAFALPAHAATPQEVRSVISKLPITDPQNPKRKFGEFAVKLSAGGYRIRVLTYPDNLDKNMQVLAIIFPTANECRYVLLDLGLTGKINELESGNSCGTNGDEFFPKHGGKQALYDDVIKALK